MSLAGGNILRYILDLPIKPGPTDLKLIWLKKFSKRSAIISSIRSCSDPIRHIHQHGQKFHAINGLSSWVTHFSIWLVSNIYSAASQNRDAQ